MGFALNTQPSASSPHIIATSTEQQKTSRPPQKLHGGALAADVLHPAATIFIALIQDPPQNVGIWRRWESSSMGALGPVPGGTRSRPTPDNGQPAPFWGCRVRGRLAIFHRCQHRSRDGHGGCGPLLRSHLHSIGPHPSHTPLTT